MALINCPECNKEISDLVNKCPNCGYPIKKKRKKKSKKSLVIILSLIGVLITTITVFGFLTFDNVKPTIEKINSIGTVTSNSEYKIKSAQNSYDSLSFIEKIFVFNKATLDKAINDLSKLPVNLTTENIEDYINISTRFSNLEDNSISVYGNTLGLGNADMEIECNSLKDMYFEDVTITIKTKFDNLSDMGWESKTISIKISENGTGIVNNKIMYDSLFRPSLPSTNDCYEIISVTGNAYKEKPKN